VDQSSLVTAGREVAAELQREMFGFFAILWVREENDQKWKLWIVLRTYKGLREFYTVISRVLTNLRRRSVHVDISDVRPIEPNSTIAVDLKRYGRVRPDFPVRLYSENLGGYYVGEALLLYHDN
jgi:hypothetical protein